MAIVKTEGRHAAEFLMYEDEAAFSREAITIKSGEGVLKAGTVVGKIGGGAGTVTVSKTDVVGAGKGALTLADPAYAVGVKEGVYRVVFIEPVTNLGTFVVEDPDGIQVGQGVAGTAFDGLVKFTIADGSSDFVAGDVALVTVAFDATARKSKWRSADPTNTDGSQVAAAVLLYEVDATSADVDVAAIVRHAVVNGNLLEHDANVDTAAKKATQFAELARHGIVVR